MTRKVQRVRYRLDAKGVKTLPPEEIAAILRGADGLIMSGGRTMLEAPNVRSLLLPFRS